MAIFSATPANWTNSSDANFRAWGSYISARMAAVGLVQTADTGQIDWLTVTAPSGTGVYQGYEIRRFADALQTIAPIYFKVEYGEGNGTDAPALRFTFGHGSDGSGNLTGSTTSAIECISTASATTVSIFGSGDTNRFIFWADYNAGTIFSVERTKDASGNDTAEGLCIHTKTGVSSAVSTAFWLCWDYTLGNKPGNPLTSTSCWGALFPKGTTATSGSQVGIAPIMPEKPIFMNPILNIVGVFSADIPVSTQFSAYMYGTAHTYRTPASISQIQNAWQTMFRGSGSSGCYPAFRYE